MSTLVSLLKTEAITAITDDLNALLSDTLPLQTDPLGSPGGAAKLGAVDADTPMVAALPPQGD